MNIAVINLKDIIKYIVSFIIIILIFSICINMINKEELKNNIGKVENNAITNIKNSSFLYCIKNTMPLITNFEKKDEKNIINTSNVILNTQLAIINSLKETEELEGDILQNNEEIISNIVEDEEENKEKILENVNTEVISENNINARYTDTVESVKINNETQFDLKEILENPDYEIKNKEKVIIYHTHTCESYTPSDKYNYEMTGVYRTTDLNYTVSRVGDELEKYLTSYGKEVIHDKTYHDYPAYNGSYGRSLKTMQNVIENNNDAEIMIDLHRDAVGSTNTYGPTVKIGDEVCAQVMFVIGSDGSGLYHPNWRENLKFAIKIQNKANEMYPGLFRPIIFRNSRYNQHLTSATTIIEVGATRQLT